MRQSFNSARLFLVLSIFIFGFAAPGFPEINKIRYHSNQELQLKFQQLANRFPEWVHLGSIGKTAAGENLLLVRVGNGTEKELDSRTGILMVGSVDGTRLTGSEVALGLVRNFAGMAGKVDSITAYLNKHVFYVIPRLNPEGADFYFKKVKWERGWNLTPTDEDEDGLTDEDGAEDLNGDGLITLMRYKDPEGAYFPDPETPELLRKADPARGEKGIYKWVTEGIDNDRDGRYNEDGPGGVNPDMNFPQDYPFGKTGAGKFMVSEKETRAFSKFVFSRENIVLIVTYGRYDNLIHPAKVRPAQRSSTETEKGKSVRFSQAITRTVDPEDIPYFDTVSKTYKKIMGLSGKAEPAAEAVDKSAGSLAKWAYFQYGVPCFTTSLITIPGPGKKAKADSSKNQKTVRPKKMLKRPGAKKEKDSLARDRRWLAYFKKTGEEGFVSWKPFHHPQLGEVEIGGFVPFVRTTAPAPQLPALIEKQTAFVAYLFGLLPELTVSNLKVEKQADDVYALSLLVRNTGFLPTGTAFASKTRLVKPVLVKIFPEKGELLSGRKITFIPKLEGSGAAKKVKWLIHAPKNTNVKIKILSEKAGTIEKTVILKD
ncbi:zinc carboxypeptidase [bacterium BMS3Abin05]|nr:zinc carboxypeptidase [bacterium BMS3Abin05]GBE27248.1 zinc carboxypeptidase [bacterium BMS3Bbin03]HDZ11799.1 hypothetical protein [Bacteroidota bacterium]